MKKTILITGANGEIGHGLVNKLSEGNGHTIVALDVSELDKKLLPMVDEFVKGDILDNSLLAKLFAKYKFDTVFHLAAMLSTSSERDPVRAHHVNTDGSINVLFHSERFSRENKRQLVVVFPSSIAVYGMPSALVASRMGAVREDEYLSPATMYGCNKLYVELLGNYYKRYYLKDERTNIDYLDFRAVRFPGIISADTMPTGGTSDYGPEMLHAAAQKKDYECFVRASSTIPFMAMPDAIKALAMLSRAEKKNLKQTVYNVGSFSISAAEIAQYAKELIHPIKVTYKPHTKRQAIVDSWPSSVNDSAARADWGWSPGFNKEDSFTKYLVPAIKARYS